MEQTCHYFPIEAIWECHEPILNVFEQRECERSTTGFEPPTYGVLGERSWTTTN